MLGVDGFDLPPEARLARNGRITLRKFGSGNDVLAA
jgi:hypothetical protein